MNTIRARSAGFCMGVSLALHKLDAAMAAHNAAHEPGASNEPGAPAASRIVMLGPIIHNPQVLAEYAARGVHCVNDLLHIRHGDTVLIRAHGLPRQEEERLRAMGAFIEDATCPKVKTAQLAIAKATAHGETLLLFGEADHPEVCGLVSYASGPCHVFSDPAYLETLDLRAFKGVVLATQTTQEQAVFQHIMTVLKIKRPDIDILCTICDATAKRQREAVDIARKVGMMVVVGGQQSGNTRRLADVTRAVGTETWLVETVDDLPPVDVLRHHGEAGLTAGASTPKKVIDAVHDFLKNVS